MEDQKIKPDTPKTEPQNHPSAAEKIMASAYRPNISSANLDHRLAQRRASMAGEFGRIKQVRGNPIKQISAVLERRMREKLGRNKLTKKEIAACRADAAQRVTTALASGATKVEV